MKNDPLLMEIQDEISRENMVRFVNKYGKLLVAAGICFFIGVAAFQFWQQYRTGESIKTGSAIYNVMREDKPQDEFALKTLQEASHNTDYFEIALLNRGALQQKANDIPGAISSYDAVAKSGTNKPLRDLAALNAATLLVNSNPKAEGLEKRLTAITADDNSYKYNARELLAAFYIQNGNKDKANEILTALVKDASAPVTVAKRARDLQAQISTPAPDTENEED